MVDWAGGGDFVLGFLRAGYRVMPPRIDFRDPKQAASECHLSWWHIRVSLKKSMYLRKQIIEGASIRCRITSENGAVDDIRDLRWRSRDKREGESLTTLQYGDAQFVPVALRDERTGRTRLTDDCFLIHGKNILDLTPQIYTIEFIVKFEGKDWPSPTYILNVPPENVSNGHFILDKIYSDET